jgi:5'-methylthioinosine phosphorylase
MVVNLAAGLGDKPITLALMRDILEREAVIVMRLLRALALEYYRG